MIFDKLLISREIKNQLLGVFTTARYNRKLVFMKNVINIGWLKKRKTLTSKML